MAGFLIVMLGMISFGICVGGVIFLLCTYILEGISLKGVYGLRGWIPFYNQYLWGTLARRKGLGVAVAAADLAAPLLGYWFLMNPGAWLWWSFVAVMLFRVAAKIFIAHQIYRNTAQNRERLYTALSVLTFGVLRPVFLFVSRKNFRMFSKTT